ncbi:MAG: glycosyltransferase family 2 protein, partial [Lachnospiraceae bacterium]|nr:glycosyltransferase family 2 protein [Lachnospiraceae bacterium]
MIPVYGVEPWLAECLDSVLAQTLTEIEVLCVDDASPDRCGEILDEYAAADPRVRVFHLPENRRQGYGRNLGMDHARGTYIYLLDSDDRIRPEALERL